MVYLKVKGKGNILYRINVEKIVFGGGGDMADNIGQCRITMNLVYMRRALDSHGRSQGLARSCV